MEGVNYWRGNDRNGQLECAIKVLFKFRNVSLRNENTLY